MLLHVLRKCQRRRELTLPQLAESTPPPFQRIITKEFEFVIHSELTHQIYFKFIYILKKKSSARNVILLNYETN